MPLFDNTGQTNINSRGMKILIVDDDINNLLLHKTVVRRLAPDSLIRAARNGKEGLNEFLATSIPFDLVITDYNMPEMNGGDMVKEMKKFQPDLITVCITSDSTYKHKEEFDLSLQKPITKSDLSFVKEQIRSNLIKILMKRRNEKNNS